MSDLDVVAIGHAIVDVLAHASDDFVLERGLVKNTMALVDEAQATSLYDAMGPAVEVSGGAAANTAAGVASFGGAAAFIGKVRDDQLGRVFTHDIRAAGVRYDTPPATDGPATARSLIIVTPDAHRTMNTYLGAAAGLAPADIDGPLVRSAAVTMLEGYLWDAGPAAVEALGVAVSEARAAGRQVALALSDPFCVERHRDEWLDLLEGGVDIVFANEHEAEALFKGAGWEDALAELQARCSVVAITRGPLGSVVAAEGSVVHVPAAPVAEVVDTTGAGDLYAAGFLIGLSRRADLERCGRLGSLAAAEVIAHVGARPQVSLARLAEDAGLLP